MSVEPGGARLTTEAPRSRRRPTRVFLSTEGQNDNLGDSVLRRGLVRTFQDMPGVELHVYTGPRIDLQPASQQAYGNDAGYLSALGFDGGEIVYESRGDWHRAALSGMLRSRTILVQYPGDLVLGDPSPLAGWRSLASTVGTRLSRGASVQAGASLREGHAVPRLERLARKWSDVVVWRDAESVRAFGIGGIMPDLAFAEGPDPSATGLGPARETRRLLAMTVRGDRERPSEAQLRLLEDLAAERGLELQVYTQVRRDRETATQLADRLHPGRPAILFGDESHADWERRMRALFRESAIVASDRAHALIIGSTEGAVPLPFGGAGTAKARRLVAPAGFEVAGDDEPTLRTYLDEMTGDPESVVRRITRARARVDAVRAELRGLTAG